MTPIHTRPLAVAVLLCGTAAAAPAALAQEVVLTMHHLLGPTSAAQTTYLQPWADRVFEQSEGRILVEIYPSMSLGGAPPDLYNQVRDGTVDLVWTVTGYTPGVFVRSEVFELPFVHFGSAEVTNQAIQDIYDEYLAEDFADVHPILVHVHAGQAIHTVDRAVRGLADLAGLKLRTPSRTGAWMIEAWGAEPVGMPVPELPQALARGTVDGALIPFEVAVPLNVHELTNYSIEGPDSLRFGTAVFLFAMNTESYESLPDDLKAVIDANSGAAIAAEVGAVWDENEVPTREATEASGSEMIVLDEAAAAEIEAALTPVQQRWVEEVSAGGIDGAALLQAAKDAVAAHSE
ncbi:MAG: TRAP transporter substrate-binding protein [Alphaproteobacteria bacterium]